jgi:hypothetical protein
MDRNLGATEAGLTVAARGLFYQWGRKDPFPAKDVTGFGIDQGPVTVTQAIQNPGTFYGIDYDVNGNDWLATARDNTLWGGDEADKPKTIYDPCPAGWRVPLSGAGNSSPWVGYGVQTFTTGNTGGYVLPVNNNGGSYTQTYWPAAGYRNNAGALSALGANGNYWSATFTGTNAYNLYFYSGGTYSNTFSRAFGLSVRCVKE